MSSGPRPVLADTQPAPYVDSRLYDYPLKRPKMPASTATRLTISWSKETDLALRSHLGARGLKKGALSAFIEDAVRWRLFEQAVETIKDRNASTDPDELAVLIDATVRDVRAEIASERQANARSA